VSELRFWLRSSRIVFSQNMSVFCNCNSISLCGLFGDHLTFAWSGKPVGKRHTRLTLQLGTNVQLSLQWVSGVSQLCTPRKPRDEILMKLCAKHARP